MKKPKKFKRTEKEITTGIRNILKGLRIFHYKQWQGLGSLKGVSDIIGIAKKSVRCPHCQKEFNVEGFYAAIEVKRPGGKLTEGQEDFLFSVKQAGGIAIVAYSVDDVIKGLGLKDRFLA